MSEDAQPPGARPTLDELIELLKARLGDPVAANDERAVAVHEAAHAVANRRYGFQINHLTIEPEGSSLGRCEAGPSPAEMATMRRPEQRRVARRKIVMCLVGNAAAEKATGPRHSTEARGDDEEILAWAGYLAREDQASPTLPAAFWQELQQESSAFLNEPTTWKTITELAAILRRRRTLTTEQVERAIADIERTLSTSTDLEEQQADAE